MTYLLLSCAFMAVAALTALWALAVHRRSAADAPFSWTAVAAAGLGLLVLTAVFDNLMIWAGLFTYADKQISGVRLGLAPVEDFSYPVAAVILLPALWVLLGHLGAERNRR